MGEALDIERTRGALIRLQRQLFRENAERITRAEAVPHPLFQQYQRAYAEATRRYREVSSIDDLVREARRVDLVYVADYHTLPQAQKTFVKLARRMAIKPSSGLVLALEIIQGKHQRFVDQYLAGRIDADALRSRIGFARMWPYDVWDNYLPILEYAREMGHPVLAVDSNRAECDTLHGRDSYAGWRIAEQLHKTPQAKIMVLMGELHLAPAHLPGVVRANLAKLGQARTDLSVHQNCEEIYWQLSGAGLADTEVVRLADDAWCVVNTPPIVRQQSYLNWIDFDESGLEYGRLTEHFVRLAEAIGHVLELSACPALEDVVVYGPGETDFLGLFASKGRYPPDLIERMQAHIAAGESFQLVGERIVYLARLTTNHAAEAAMCFIRNVTIEAETSPATKPYAALIERATGFFGSKILNHKRKTSHRGAFMRLLRHAQAGRDPIDTHQAAVARLVVGHLTQSTNEIALGTFFCGADEGVGWDALRALGNMLGERLYYGLLEGRVSRADVRALLGTSTATEDVAKAVYMSWVDRLQGVRIPARI